MARVRYEQRSTLLALEAYLTSKGWTGITYTDGYQSDKTITNPQVTVTFPPRNKKALQIGNNGDKLFIQRVLVNAYMENEPRAQTIVDDIMDFMEEICVTITTPAGTGVGSLICQDDDSIRGEVFPPILGLPKMERWRGAVQGSYEAFYPA